MGDFILGALDLLLCWVGGVDQTTPEKDCEDKDKNKNRKAKLRRVKR